MKRREEEIGKLIELLSQKSDGFTKPKIITIGGYALRAYVPFSRYTRDCDFVVKKENGWHLDKIKRWLPKDVSVETFQKENNHGFLRFIKLSKFDKKSMKISIDFMEGEVRGRTEEQVVLIDNAFTENSKGASIPIGEREIKIFVPSYTDYLILKMVSGRPSDVRDIAALIWKNGIPKDTKQRVKKILPYPTVLHRVLQDRVITDISDKRFVNSWRGTFVTTEFTEEDKNKVLRQIKEFLI